MVGHGRAVDEQQAPISANAAPSCKSALATGRLRVVIWGQNRLFTQQNNGDAAISGQGGVVREEGIGGGLARHLVDTVLIDSRRLHDLAGIVGAAGGQFPVAGVLGAVGVGAGMARDGDSVGQALSDLGHRAQQHLSSVVGLALNISSQLDVL